MIRALGVPGLTSSQTLSLRPSFVCRNIPRYLRPLIPQVKSRRTGSVSGVCALFVRRNQATKAELTGSPVLRFPLLTALLCLHSTEFDFVIDSFNLSFDMVYVT